MRLKLAEYEIPSHTLTNIFFVVGTPTLTFSGMAREEADTKVGCVRACHPRKEGCTYKNYRREHLFLMYLESLSTRKREAGNNEEKDD